MNNPGFHGASQDVSRKKSIAQIVDARMYIYLYGMDAGTCLASKSGSVTVWWGGRRSASPRDVKE